MLVRRRERLDAAARRRARRGRRPRRSRSRPPRGARGGRRPRPRPGRPVGPARHRGAARGRGRAAAGGLPRGGRRLCPRRSAPGPRSAWTPPTPRRWPGSSTRASPAPASAPTRSPVPPAIERLGPLLETLERPTRRCSSIPGPRGRAARRAALVGARSPTTWRRCRRPGTPSPSGAGRRTRGCGCASRCSPAWRRCTASG